jgi:hypothetical protein
MTEDLRSTPATVSRSAEDLPGELLAPAATELVDGFSFEAADLSFDLAREAAQLNLVRGPSLSRPSLPNSPAR